MSKTKRGPFDVLVQVLPGNVHTWSIDEVTWEWRPGYPLNLWASTPSTGWQPLIFVPKWQDGVYFAEGWCAGIVYARRWIEQQQAQEERPDGGQVPADPPPPPSQLEKIVHETFTQKGE